MLSFKEKIILLENYLEIDKGSYADSFKDDIHIYFDSFENMDKNDPKLQFLKKLNSKKEIENWVDKLTSRIVMKFDEEEMSLFDFIYYEINIQYLTK
ncbi:MAG: hypothetical protein LAT67_10760 [Balneolales bacterium]|nr:hypothetical protein [Balneolales bacterium]